MNPLYAAMNGSVFAGMGPATAGVGMNPSMNQNALMGQLQANPVGMLRNAGYSVPDELSGNPQAMFQHLMQTGQIGGPMMQRIQPMLRMLTGK